MLHASGTGGTAVHFYLTPKGAAERIDLGTRDLGFVPQGGEEPVVEWNGRRVRARINQIRIDFADEPAQPVPEVHAREL